MQTYLSQLTRYCESMWSMPKEEWETYRQYLCRVHQVKNRMFQQ